ncbi:conjugal transfer protein TraH [bacterium AH-315-K03]|nr:conjugal transfer protein TraH [bacterium AH-315-K03]
MIHGNGSNGLALAIVFSIGLIILSNAYVQADIESDMSDFFDSLGYTNVTDPGVYQSQSAGYYTAGSLYTRAPSKNYQLLSANLPSVRSGCGGIDLWGGSFSFINEDQLVAMLRNIGQNAVGFAFNLALSTISPKTEELVNKMQAYANSINAMNINSCEQAAAVVGGLWSKTDESQKQVCQAIGTSSGLFSDWAAARQGCGAAGQRSATLQSAREGQFSELIFDEGNIAWKALQKNDWTRNDVELAELIMNITGTIVIRRTGGDDEPIVPRYIPPSLSESDINVLMRGGVINGLRCADGTQENECLDLEGGEFTVSLGFSDRVADILLAIVNAILSDSELAPNGVEMGLLNATSLPVYKMLSVFSAYNPAMATQKATDYADIIAIDILFTYLQTVTDAAVHSSRVLQLPSDVMNAFREQADGQRRFIINKRETLLARAQRSIKMIEETQLIERTLISTLSPGLSASYNWSKMLQ